MKALTRGCLAAVILAAAACRAGDPPVIRDIPKPAPDLGGSSVEGVYVQDIEVSLLMARRALRSLEVTLTGDEAHADWARIDGLRRDSTPVRVRIDRVEPEKIKVTFTAGLECSEDNLAFAHRMQVEYESVTQIKGAGD
jgi:hypothetical protein